MDGGGIMINTDLFKIDGSKILSLNDCKPDYTSDLESKTEADGDLRESIDCMIEEQGKLYAMGEYAVLIILQAMDAAGKDGIVKHVMSGLNPQGTQVFSFKQPSKEELMHDYMWRYAKSLPERGKIGIFNRSYYEEVLVVRVHDMTGGEHIPEKLREDIWNKRFAQIRNFEKYLCENGIIPLKFFLNISKEEQKKRLELRILDKTKKWKFSEDDYNERRFWDGYQKAYEDAINMTATDFAPWFVIPSDKKWYSRLAVSSIIARTLKNLKLRYPKPDKNNSETLLKYKNLLEGK